MLLAEVALADATRSYDRLYDYIVAADNDEDIVPGVRVLVPFGIKNKLKPAWIINIRTDEPTKKLKRIAEIVDRSPLLSSEMIKLAQWMKKRYFCTWGDAIRLMVPAGINLKKQSWLRIAGGQVSEQIKTLSLTSTQQSIMEILIKNKEEGLPEQEFFRNGEAQKDIRFLIDNGLVEKYESFAQPVNEKTVKAVIPAINKDDFDALVEEGKVKSIYHIRAMEVLFTEEICALRDLLQITGISHATVRTLAKKGWVSYCEMEVERDPFGSFECEKPKDIILTDEQKNVLKEILPLVSENKLNEVLLHGVTGSGKTEIYIRLIEEVVKNGKTAIVLVPEISLTPQMINCFTARFGNRVAIQHSRLSQGERFDQWHKIKAGSVDVVIGARSAVFAPNSNLGIIIIDEEHEPTYKSENTPKYDARQIARARCNMNGCLLVLGSATPSVETYYRAGNGRIGLLTMKNRPNSMPLPEMILVDLREELRAGNRSVLSRRLEEELISNKKSNEQSILFLNKRGYATFLLCRECGFTLKCPRCSVTLTVHTYDKLVICHYCGYSEPIPGTCPGCSSKRIKAFGTGTQKVENELQNHSEGFKLIRMDMDTTSGKHGHQKILNAFRNKEGDILIGTQMVAKGHDFPDVTLVGILAADASLFSSDYRASERTFQLITQASGRAGRGTKPGRVIVQAYNIDDYAIQTAILQDYEAFYQKEIAMRKLMYTPPFCHIGVIMVSGEDPDDARECMEAARKKIINSYGDTNDFQCSEVLPLPVFVVKNRARWRIIIKMVSINKMVTLMNDILDIFPKIRVGNTDISVDIDGSL
ncbi:MAG: primosomal protein N' [Clostridiaceae bacterium]|jgi:primosomal protein N' (replication factor Y)|nr:primosomal protein N' [Clostridiaceae bacterium]